MKRKLLILLTILALTLMVGVAAAQDEDPIRIGLLVDQSGWLTLYGIEQANGFILGLLYEAGVDVEMYDNINDALAEVRVAGRPVELIIRDYGSENPASDADNAAALARELIESDFVDIIYGTPNSGAAVQVQELTKPDNYDMIFFAGPAASPTLTGANFNPNTFRVCRNTLQDALTYATIADQFGTDYIIMSVDTDFGRGTAAAFELALGMRGISFVGETVYFPTDATDFTPYLQRVLDSGAETVVQVSAGANSLLLTQQTVEMGLLEAMNVVGGTNSNPIVVAAPPPAGTVAYIVYQYTLPDTEINDWMTEQHIRYFSSVPDLFTECSFASAQAIVQALNANGGDPLPEAMIPALEGLEWEGPKGTYFMRASDHQALSPLYVIRFMGIEQVELSEDVTATLPIYELVAEADALEIAPPCLLVGDYADRCEMDG